MKTTFLILSGEGDSRHENQFVIECCTIEEATKTFGELKPKYFANTTLLMYEAKKLREE
jgi:hypothetical protein